MPFKGGSARAMPFEGTFYGSLRAAPFEGTSYSSLRATPLECTSYNSLRAAPFEGTLYGSVSFEGISYVSLQAATFDCISYGSLRPALFEGISYNSVQASLFEYGSFQGTTCIFLQPLSVRDIFYCSHQVVSLNNIQPVCFVHSYECDCFFSAHWYLGDLVVQIIELVLSYLSPVIKFMLEFTQKITIWYNVFMLHWFTSLCKTRNSMHLDSCPALLMPEFMYCCCIARRINLSFNVWNK